LVKKETAMRTYDAGGFVKKGFYWNTTTWKIELVAEDGVLPGREGERYYGVPVLALFVLAPLMGAAYVMFLPFIGFVMLFRYGGRRLRDAVVRRRMKTTKPAEAEETFKKAA
jgi:hypothetical protein